MVDALAGKISPFEIKDIRRGQKGLTRIETAIGPDLSQKFSGAIHSLFGLEGGQPIVKIDDKTSLDDLRLPIMDALQAGFDVVHQISKDNIQADEGAHEFLDAMAFLNRREAKYAQAFFRVIRTMSAMEQIQATRDFYNGFERIKQKEIDRQGIGMQVIELFRGPWMTYRHWGGSGLFDRMEKRIKHAEGMRKMIIDKASLAVK